MMRMAFSGVGTKVYWVKKKKRENTRHEYDEFPEMISRTVVLLFIRGKIEVGSGKRIKSEWLKSAF
jgi:hypothetical protein